MTFVRRIAIAVAVLGVSFLGVPLRAQSVAILPFANATPTTTANAQSLDWIGESIAETLREAFALKSVVTLDRNAIEAAYQRVHLKARTAVSDASILKLGETLDAEEIVYGSFTFRPGSLPDSKGTLRISVRMIDRRKLKQSLEHFEEGKLEELAKLEAHLSWRALMLVQPKAAPPETDFATLREPIRLDAQENYVRGLLAPPIEKEKFFKQAASIEPKFSRPCFELGKIYYQKKQYREAAVWLERVSPADVHYREANFVLGLARFELADYAAAQKAFQMIVAVIPLSEVWNNLAAAESRRNLLPQAVEDFRKALDLDSSDPDYHFNTGYALYKKGDFAGAADRFRAVVARDPDDEIATSLLGRCLKKQGLRIGDTKGPDARYQALERIKKNYEERAYWQLKSVLESKPE